jgi:hypothetical protein
MAQLLISNEQGSSPWLEEAFQVYYQARQTGYLRERSRQLIAAAAFWIGHAQDSNSAEVSFFNSQLALGNQDYVKALAQAQAAVRLAPTEPRYRFQVARLEALLMHSEQAVADYQTLALAFPATAARAQFLAGSALEQAGELPRAFELYQQAGVVADQPDIKLTLLYHLYRIPYARLGQCNQLARIMGSAWLSRMPRWQNAFASQDQLCHGKVDLLKQPQLRAQWYLQHGQPLKALPEINGYQERA